ncbi:MAG TPA: RNA-protein complex protein Nop10 [Candidatus Woesearchaeota archaeon]|nr:RNA-protein complex protein Nop10 [Candidatus Woesearchaeota archaeon]
MRYILKCVSCGRYTLKEACPACSSKAVRAVPPKYSPDDKYGSYRRQVKEETWMKEGLL